MDFFSLEAILNLLTLTTLEIVLGIDNVIFIALLVLPLKGEERKRTRIIGLSLALVMRILMLLGATWIMQLTNPLFALLSHNVSGRDLLLILGGLFLIVKSLKELVELFRPSPEEKISQSTKYWGIIGQIIFIDMILSFDSIITAVGMTNDLPIMITAIIIAMIIMLVASEPIGQFIYKYPSVKVIALVFIAFVGAMLLCNGLDLYFNKGYLYFSMFFASIVETINIYLQKKSKN
jgi:predicted tellurium resistance membrane protein TerC